MAKPAAAYFDFERWSTLARRDPRAFELERAAAIDALIERAPAERRRRLRCLQWRVDQVRRTVHNPLVACERISRMMWDRILDEHGLLDSLYRLGEVVRTPGMPARVPRAPRRNATVLSFPSRRP